MDGADRELGWEDVGFSPAGAGGGSGSGPAVEGTMGSSSGAGASSGLSSDFAANLPVDAMSQVMIEHIKNSVSKGGLSYMPQIMHAIRRYFNVHHGYVLRKMMWQLVPMDPPKKKDGELSGDKDWTARFYEGLEVSIEEPDLYIPMMGLATYVLLCGLIRGLQEQFHPHVIYATTVFALFLLLIELVVVKVALSMTGAPNAPAVDIAAILAYKFYYLSLVLMLGLILGLGAKPEGFLYHFFALGLMASCSVAFFQTFRRLARMQPTPGGSNSLALSTECVSDIHKTLIRGLPILEVAVCFFLMPTWPKARAPVPQAAAAVTTKVAQAAATAATTMLPAVKAAVAAAGNASKGGS